MTLLVKTSWQCHHASVARGQSRLNVLAAAAMSDRSCAGRLPLPERCLRQRRNPGLQARESIISRSHALQHRVPSVPPTRAQVDHPSIMFNPTPARGLYASDRPVALHSRRLPCSVLPQALSHALAHSFPKLPTSAFALRAQQPRGFHIRRAFVVGVLEEADDAQ